MVVSYDPTIYQGAAAHYGLGRPAYSPQLEAVLSQELDLGLALGPDAVWTVAFEHQRLWRALLESGPARPVLRVGDFLYGLTVNAGRVWVLSASGRSRPPA